MEETKPSGLFKKWAHVMSQLERLPKNGHNDHFNYDFVTDADVSDTIRPLLAEQGVAVLVSADAPTQETGKTLLPLKITLIDSESGERETVTWFGEASDKQDKGINKAATAAVKYWLLKTFLLSTGDPAEDADSGPLQGTPEFLRTPEQVTNFYFWLFHDKGMTKEQVAEAFNGHPLSWRGGDGRVAKATVELYLQEHSL